MDPRLPAPTANQKDDPLPASLPHGSELHLGIWLILQHPNSRLFHFRVCGMMSLLCTYFNLVDLGEEENIIAYV